MPSDHSTKPPKQQDSLYKILVALLLLLISASAYFYVSTFLQSHQKIDYSDRPKPYFLSMLFAVASAYCSLFINRTQKHRYYLMLFVIMAIFAAFVFYQALSGIIELGNV